MHEAAPTGRLALAVIAVAGAVGARAAAQEAGGAPSAAPAGSAPVAAAPETTANTPAPAEKADHWWLWGESRPTDWTVQLEPGVWYMGLGGDMIVAGGTTFSASDVNIDDPEFSPAGEAHIRGGDLTFSLSAFGYGGDETAGARNAFTAGGVAAAVGTPVRTEIDIVSAELAVGYEVFGWRTKRDCEACGLPWPQDAEVRVDVYAGARFLNMSTDLTIGGAAVSDEGYTLHPLIGARFTLEMFERTTVDLAADVGYFPGSTRSATAFNVVAGFSWRPWGNIGATFGYRILSLQMEDGSQEFDGSLAGVFANVVIRF